MMTKWRGAVHVSIQNYTQLNGMPVCARACACVCVHVCVCVCV